METKLADALDKLKATGNLPSPKPSPSKSPALSDPMSPDHRGDMVTTGTTAVSTKVVYTQENRQAIAASLGACLVVQRTYGKQGSDIGTMTKVFCAALAQYEPQQVMDALKQWLTISPEFPTPADIKQLIDPAPVWMPTLFQELVDKKKRGDILTFREEEYLKGFKANALKGL